LEQNLAQNPAQQKHLNELRRARLLAQCAMQKRQSQPNGAVHRLDSQPRRWLTRALAASALIAVGYLAGHGLRTLNPPADLQSYLSGGSLVIQPAVLSADQDMKAIYHISTADPDKLRGALDEVEILLSVYAKSGRTLRLEIIANAEGLNLLRADTSTASERVQALQQDYKNVKFLACGKTIERLQLKNNLLTVPLLPGVDVVPSALDQVILRMQDGWSYIRA
jgi:intracellular sulfur oxidation DsrE/DsrF family protein